MDTDMQSMSCNLTYETKDKTNYKHKGMWNCSEKTNSGRWQFSSVRPLKSLLPHCETLVLPVRGVTWWHGLVYHSHSAGRRHHTHQCPYRGTCSRGRLLLGRSLSFLLFHYFSRALWKQTVFILPVVDDRQQSVSVNCCFSPSYSVFLGASRFLHSVPTSRLSSPKEKSGCLALMTARISLLNKM